MRVAMEEQGRRSINRLLVRHAERSADMYRRGGSVAVDLLTGDLIRETESELRSIYNDAAMEAGGRLFASVGKSSRASIEKKDAQNIFREAMNRWIDVYALDKARTIAGTTKELVRQVIDARSRAGESSDQIADAIEKETGGSVSRARAEVIARTEVNAAASAGSDEAAKSTQLQLTREWLTVGDFRVRDSHVATDGQLRGMDEPFEVPPGSGVHLMRPADPAGPAGEVIQCRCVLLYHDPADLEAGGQGDEP